MIPAMSINSAPLNQSNHPNTGAAFRILRPEFTELEGYLQPHFNDELTQTLRLWLRGFKQAAGHTNNAQKVRNDFMNFLREHLQEPITNRPLGDDALLGSDGITYHPLTVIAHGTSPGSPLYPNSDAPLTVSPHPIVGQMLRWIEYHSQPAANDRKDRKGEASLERSSSHRHIPRPTDHKEPSDRKERIRRNMERQRQLREEIDPLLIQRLEAIRIGAHQHLQEAFQPIAAEQEEFEQAGIRRIEALEILYQERVRALEASVIQLDLQVEQMRIANEELRASLDAHAHQLTETRRHQDELQITLNEVRKALDERKSSFGKILLSAVAVTAICVGGSILLSQALSGTSFNAALVPIKSGGGLQVGAMF